MLLGLDKLFGGNTGEVRRMPVAESAAITEMRGELARMEERHRKEMDNIGRPGMLAWGAPVFNMLYDGEKSGNGMGPAFHYQPWYDMLRARSWQAYLDSPLAQLIINKYVLWIIGDGLRLQAEPDTDVLASEKYFNINEADFEKLAERRYNLYTGSHYSDYADMTALDELVYEMEKNATVGGDVLVIQRYIDGQVKVQLIDGAHVRNPIGMLELNPTESEYTWIDPSDKTRVSYGVKLDKTGRHLGYYVSKGLNEYEYIPARDKDNGHIRAFLYYGLKYRIDNVRGLPLIAAVMEKLKRLEKWDEAILAGAEERAKVPYFFEHELGASGENPQQSRLAKALGVSAKGDLPTDINGAEMARLVAVTLQKDVWNLPPGAKAKAMDSDITSEYTPFLTTNIQLVSATLSIPPDVAMSMYDSNYSASRAAIKDWEHVVSVKRARVGRNFYQHNYNMWLDIEVLSFRINAPGYLRAKADGNVVALAAYRKAKFVGAQVPHIDPLKEIKAIRAKLGPIAANVPLMSIEEAAEMSNGGDMYTNLQKLKDALDKYKELGLPEVVAPQQPAEKPKEKEEED